YRRDCGRIRPFYAAAFAHRCPVAARVSAIHRKFSSSLGKSTVHSSQSLNSAMRECCGSAQAFDLGRGLTLLVWHSRPRLRTPELLKSCHPSNARVCCLHCRHAIRQFGNASNCELFTVNCKLLPC